MIHLKDLIEQLTDQRISERIDNWKLLQFSFYVTKRNGRIVIVNTPY
jgi:hypothetical protein